MGNEEKLQDFEDNLARLLGPSGWYSMSWAPEIEFPAWEPEDFDFEAVVKLFVQYGYYLELNDPTLDLSAAEVQTRLDVFENLQ